MANIEVTRNRRYRTVLIEADDAQSALRALADYIEKGMIEPYRLHALDFDYNADDLDVDKASLLAFIVEGG